MVPLEYSERNTDGDLDSEVWDLEKRLEIDSKDMSVQVITDNAQ